MNKEKRIRKNEEFQAIIAKKHSSANRCFIIYYDLKKQENARVGISVSKKLGKAVQRNKIKRQLRMMISETIDFNTFNPVSNDSLTSMVSSSLTLTSLTAWLIMR